jgi:hypothetical protein
MIDFDVLVLAPNFSVWSEGNRGKPVPVYTSQAGGPSTAIDGIFRIPSLTEFGAGAGGAPGLTTRKPELDVRASQVPAGVTIVQGDTISVRGVAYTVMDVRPDGEGLITLLLSEAPIF